MRKHLFLATATAVVLGCTACSGGSNGHPSGHPSRHPNGLGAPANSVVSTETTRTSAFCDLARQVGKSNLGVSAGNLDPDPKKLLSQVDRLNAIAPPELKKDFDVFAGFEHAVIDPGSPGPSAPVRGDTTVALEHVSSYFTDVCAIK